MNQTYVFKECLHNLRKSFRPTKNSIMFIVLSKYFSGDTSGMRNFFRLKGVRSKNVKCHTLFESCFNITQNEISFNE